MVLKQLHENNAIVLNEINDNCPLYVATTCIYTKTKIKLGL